MRVISYESIPIEVDKITMIIDICNVCAVQLSTYRKSSKFQFQGSSASDASCKSGRIFVYRRLPVKFCVKVTLVVAQFSHYSLLRIMHYIEFLILNGLGLNCEFGHVTVHRLCKAKLCYCL